LKTLSTEDENRKERKMIIRQIILAGCAATILGIASAQAGPCNTAGKDAGSGPTPGSSGQTTGTASTNVGQHPPTDGLNRVAGNAATSPEDAQKQMQGQPTAAQEARGAQPSAKMADQGC
jgi:hypothetical protein